MVPLRQPFVPILAIALVCFSAGLAGAQQKPEEYSGIRFVEDARWRQVIAVARDLIQDKDWNDAVKVLQHVLDDKEDHFIRVASPDPADAKKQVIRWRSAKAEANELIGSMPPAGLRVYEAAHGADARALLELGRRKKDAALIAEVVVRYRHTKAGIEAINLLAKMTFVEEPKLEGWPSWRGNASHTLQAAAGGPPDLAKKLWSRPIMMDVLDGFKEVDPDQPAKQRVDDAVKQVRDLKQPVLPGFFPIASQGVIVYRTQRDVRAVALKEIQTKDAQTGEVISMPMGHMLWKTIPLKRSLSVLLEKNHTSGKANSWLDEYAKVQGLNSILYENTLIGTLATDGRNVYVIDDLSVPPHPGVFTGDRFEKPINKVQEFKPLLMQNELAAYDLVTGKLRWDLNASDAMFKDSHFLSMPISIGGKLYVLNERLLNPNAGVGVNPFGGGGNPIGGESELRLVCIDPTKILGNKPTIVGPPQPLGNVLPHHRFVQDMSRRVNTVALAYADGMLVCPTNAGTVFGIELPARNLAWAYAYRESEPEPLVLPGMEAPKGKKGTTVVSKWKSAPPALQDGKVVFTAPDADSVHCVNLRDGKPAWKKPRQDGDLYLAGVFAGRVLIVGAKNVRALDLKDGSQLWSLALGDLPAGQGAASKDVYYLPLEKEIIAIDIVKGEIKSRTRIPAGASVGNLVFYDNMVLSQSATTVTAYPQSKGN